MKIAIIQQVIPHYREPFFKGLKDKFHIDIFTYFKKTNTHVNNLFLSNIKTFGLWSIYIFKFYYYNIFKIIKNKYDVIIIPAEIRGISNWLLLILPIKTKIILWGHVISVNRYLIESRNLPLIKKYFLKMADYVWLYTFKEKELLEKFLHTNKTIALNNTIDTQPIIRLNQNKTFKRIYKEYCRINQETIFIYCARFTNLLRRNDLLIKFIEIMDPKKYGFIIIGDGPFKPDFTKYSNVYDFGAVYDFSVKSKLFSISDLYFQPAWLGLSVVEALAYGKPIFTLERSKDIVQCVEYAYVKHLFNGYIAENLFDLALFINNLNKLQLKQMQKNSVDYVKMYLTIEKMILNSINSLEDL